MDPQPFLSHQIDLARNRVFMESALRAIEILVGLPCPDYIFHQLICQARFFLPSDFIVPPIQPSISQVAEWRKTLPTAVTWFKKRLEEIK
jgi:hypothetical protein